VSERTLPVENNEVILSQGGWRTFDIVYTATNNSKSALTIDSIEVINTDGSAFSLVEPSRCRGVVLLPLGDCTFTVSFSPPKIGKCEGLLRLYIDNTVKTERLYCEDRTLETIPSSPPTLPVTSSLRATPPDVIAPREPSPTSPASPSR
jgi:hypothetical protein